MHERYGSVQWKRVKERETVQYFSTQSIIRCYIFFNDFLVRRLVPVLVQWHIIYCWSVTNPMSLYMRFVTWPTHLSSHVMYTCAWWQGDGFKWHPTTDFFIWRGDNFALQNVRFLSKLPLQNTWTAITWLSLHHLSVDYPRHPSSKGFTALHYYIEKSKRKEKRVFFRYQDSSTISLIYIP